MYKTRWHTLCILLRSALVLHPGHTSSAAPRVFIRWQINSVFLDVGNRSGKMDLAALGVEFKSPFGPSDGAIVLGWREETEVGRLLFSLQKTERKTFKDLSLPLAEKRRSVSPSRRRERSRRRDRCPRPRCSALMSGRWHCLPR